MSKQEIVNLGELFYNALNGKQVRKIMEDRDFFKKIVDFIKNDGCLLPKKTKMIDRFFGIEEAKKFFGIKPSAKEMSILEGIPFSEKELKKCRHTHILVAIFPTTLLKLQKIAEKIKMPNGKPFFDDEIGHKHAQFMNLTYGENGKPIGDGPRKPFWILFNATEIERSEEWGLQIKFPAPTLLYIVIGHYLNTGEELFKNQTVGTSTFEKNREIVFDFFPANMERCRNGNVIAWRRSWGPYDESYYEDNY